MVNLMRGKGLLWLYFLTIQQKPASGVKQAHLVAQLAHGTADAKDRSNAGLR